MSAKSSSPKYRAISAQIGFRSDTGFVKVNDGSVSFTMDAPVEIRALHRPVVVARLAPSGALVATATGRNYSPARSQSGATTY